MTITKHISELLMPAGSLEKLKVALLYGADAVYMGTPDMSLRTKSDFSLEDVMEGVQFTHECGKRAYLTLNLFSHNKDAEKLPSFIDTIREIKPDGVIIADPGVFSYVKENAPELELHISTQANICSWLSVKFWEDMGADLCVLAREVSFSELTEIREKCPDIKLESFVHGSMCMTYSGRCLLSNFMSERGANQGNCAHNCRWKYNVYLEETTRLGEYMPIEEDNRGSYIMNSRDLCLMPKLDELLALGVDSLKVEGRNKGMYYLAIVARAYRMAIDDWRKNPEEWSPKEYMKELNTVPNRGFTLAFYDGRLTNLAHNYEDTHSFAEYEFAGFITDWEEDSLLFEAKNHLEAGDVLEFIPPNSRDVILLRMYEFFDVKKKKALSDVHGGQKPIIRVPLSLFDQEDSSSLKEKLPIGTVIRKERTLTAEEINRLKFDAEAGKIEGGAGSTDKYDKKREALIESIDEKSSLTIHKTPRIGKKGCCGRGCNGCMIFWNDTSYEKARQLLAKKKSGERLNRAEI